MLKKYLHKLIESKPIYSRILSITLLCVGLLFLFIGDSASAAAIAAAGLFYSAYVYESGKSKDESKFYLEKYIEASKKSLEILNNDKPSIRVAWITAANIANQSKSLEMKITQQPDLDFLSIYKRSYMHLLMDFFSTKSACYFYGVPEIKDLKKAAEKSSAKPLVSNGLIPAFNKILYIDESNIKSVLKLIDPVIIEEEGYSIFDAKDEMLSGVLKLNLPALYEYLNYKNKETNPYN